MGIITVTKLKCDKCGLEANCAGFTPNEAKTIMRKRGWIFPGKGAICPNCKISPVIRTNKSIEREE
mgnify:CR=1 FL=1